MDNKYVNKALELSSKVASNVYLDAISKGLMGTLPILIIGSIGCLLGVFPFDPYLQFIEKIGVKTYFLAASTVTTSCLSIYAAFLIGYRLAGSFKCDRPTRTAHRATGCHVYPHRNFSVYSLLVHQNGFDLIHIRISVFLHDILQSLLNILLCQNNLFALLCDDRTAALHVTASATTIILLYIFPADRADFFERIDHAVHGRNANAVVPLMRQKINFLTAGIFFVRNNIDDQLALLCQTISMFLE